MSEQQTSSPGVEALLDRLTKTKAESLLDSLTDRETEVMIGLAHTKTRKQIGSDLDISETRVAQLTANAKRRMGVKDRSDAVAAFVIARQLCDKPVYTEKHLKRANDIINKLVSDQTTEEAFRQITSQEFREYLRDLRSSGPKAMTAKYGPNWRYVAGALVAIIVMAAVLLSLYLGPALDALSQ